MSETETTKTKPAIFNDAWHIVDKTAFTTYDKRNFAKLKKTFARINELQALRDYNARLCLEHRCKMSEAEYWGKVDACNNLDKHIDNIYYNFIDTPILRKLNDKTLVEDDPMVIAPLETRLKEDRITLGGIVIFNQQIMSQSISRIFSHLGVGEGMTPAGPNDLSLGIEITRVNIKESGGNYKASGVVLRWDAMIDILTETFTCTEAAIFNGPKTQSGVVMGARSVLEAAQGIDHTYGNDFLYVRMLAQTLSA